LNIKATLEYLAEVVGSNPTQSIFINLVNYCIKLSLFLLVSDARLIFLAKIARMQSCNFVEVKPEYI